MNDLPKKIAKDTTKNKDTTIYISIYNKNTYIVIYN